MTILAYLVWAKGESADLRVCMLHRKLLIREMFIWAADFGLTSPLPRAIQLEVHPQTSLVQQNFSVGRKPFPTPNRQCPGTEVCLREHTLIISRPQRCGMCNVAFLHLPNFSLC